MEAIQPGLSPRPILEQSNCFVFKDGQVMTFNGAVCCQAPSPLGKSFVGAVEHGPLLGILRKYPDEDVTVDLSQAGKMIFAAKNKKTRLKTQAEVLLPVHAIEKPLGGWQPLHEEFCEAVNVVKDCAGADESKPASTCLHLHPEYVEACDDSQAARYKVKTGLAKSVLVPKDCIKHIIALDMTEYATSPKWIFFRNPAGMVLCTLRYTYTYPDLGELFKVKGAKATLPRGLADAADRAETFSQEDEDNNLISVELSPGKIKVVGEGAAGDHTEVKAVGYEGEPRAFLINPKLLVEILKRQSECYVSGDKIWVRGEKFTYFSCLSTPEEVSGGEAQTATEEESD